MTDSIHLVPRSMRHGVAGAIVLGFVLAACGGGGDDEVLQLSAQPPLQASSADGRLPASALSDGEGRFTMRLPARTLVTLAIDRTDGDSQPKHVGATPSKSSACLLDAQA